MCGKVSLALFCCVQEELLWFLVVAALIVSIPLVLQCQEAHSGEKAHACVNQISALVL